MSRSEDLADRMYEEPRREICREVCPLVTDHFCGEHKMMKWALGLMVTTTLAFISFMVKQIWK